MRITRDIHSLSDFKQNASKFVKQVQETKEPLVLTVNGKPAVVLHDVESYQASLDREERMNEIALVRKRLDNLANGGKRIPAEEVFRKIGKKYGIKIRKVIG